MAHIPKQPIDPALQAEENAKRIEELDAQLNSLSQRFDTMSQRYVNTYVRSDNTTHTTTKGFKIIPLGTDVNFFVFYKGVATLFGFFNAHIHSGKLYYTPEQSHGVEPYYDNSDGTECINVPTGAYGRITVIADQNFELVRYY